MLRRTDLDGTAQAGRRDAGGKSDSGVHTVRFQHQVSAGALPEMGASLLYRGKDRIKRGDVPCVQCDEFLLALKPNHIPR